MDPDIEEAEAAIKAFSAWLGPKPPDEAGAARWAVRAGAFRTLLRRTMAAVDQFISKEK